MSRETDNLAGLRAEIEAAERRVAGEIDPGARGVVVAVVVFVLLGTFALPHTGNVRGWDVLFNSHGAGAAAIAVTSRIFVWLALVFGVGFSMLALIIRRWTLACIALAGSSVAVVAGLLAIWSRQTVSAGHPGPGVGLYLGWLAVIVLVFHWSRVVVSRTMVHLAAEEHRRRVVAEQQAKTLLDTVGEQDGPDNGLTPFPHGRT